ncbi:MAG: FAD-dependent oxidoreductase [Nitriliruptoraceae bacterium]|nr:FAD-dependent oxidoreductase [Nitriliruptoraceae bacterium]
MRTSPPTGGPRNGAVSFWMHDLDGPAPATDRLEGDADADVVIVGAGYTGLWTAYYLHANDPSLRIRVLEQRHVGFGASGRNGGWLTNSLTGGHEAYARRHGDEAVRRFQRALNDTVDEVLRVAHAEGIDAQATKGGSLLVARNPAQQGRVAQAMAHARRWPEEGLVALDAGEVRERIRVAGALGGLWQPHCARIHPARLVTGLATTLRARGVAIHEDTPVLDLASGQAVTPRGTVRAPVVIRATEGFTSLLPGHRRTWLPMNSSMIVTEPLAPEVWATIGWEAREALEDLSHIYAYAQRTTDGRIAIGGRGVPYRFGSRIDGDGLTDRTTWSALAGLLRSWFPAVGDVPVAHTWSGVLGVPRNWRATVSFDRATGLGHAGGYVGTGVAATNLAGRTLADLVCGVDSDLVDLPWVGQRSRRWEPEPLRWLGARTVHRAYLQADRAEAAGLARTSAFATAANLLSGR